jgi:hypothetical protein
MPLYNNASAVCTPMENAALQYLKGQLCVRSPAKQGAARRVQPGWHTYVEMGNDWHAGLSAADRALDFECPA